MLNYVNFQMYFTITANPAIVLIISNIMALEHGRQKMHDLLRALNALLFKPHL